MRRWTLHVRPWALGLPIVALVGFAPRLAYALHASLYIDEFTTIWAAQRVLELGVPRFPSGAIYTQGLVYTYFEALFLALGTHAPLLARLPSLMLSCLTLLLLVWAARRLFGTPWPGLAALWLALDAEAILWGGRARSYSLLALLVLLGSLAWYWGAIEDDRPAFRWVALGALGLALVDQPVTLLAWPPLILVAVVVRGYGWLRQPTVWAQGGVALLVLLARLWIYRLLVPAGAVASEAPRAFADLAHPLTGLEDMLPFLTEPNRWLPALLLLGGAVFVLVSARTRGRRAWSHPLVVIALLMAALWLEMMLLVGVTWRHPRYLIAYLPLLFLGAEGAVTVFTRQLPRRLPAVVTLAVSLLIATLAYPTAHAAANRDEYGYDLAFARVQQQAGPQDAVASIVPLGAFVTAGRCDYLAIEEGIQAYLVEREGRRVDGWTLLPLLDSPQALEAALQATPGRLWLVVDEMRLERHFGPDYARLLWDRFDLLAVERETFVFVSRPDTPSPVLVRPLEVDFAGQLRLSQYALSNIVPAPEEVVTLTLYWTAGEPEGTYAAFVHLDGPAGRVAQADGPPARADLYPPARWSRIARSLPLPDRRVLALPAGLEPGRYRIQVGLYRPGTLEEVGEPVTLDFLRVGLPLAPEPSVRLDAPFGSAVTLQGFDLEGAPRPGVTLRLRMHWQVEAGLEADYTVFLHLLDAEGGIAQQWDGPPVGGWYPTSFWDPGETVLDEHALPLRAGLAPGTYRLIGGLYRADGARLITERGRDFIELVSIQIQP